VIVGIVWIESLPNGLWRRGVRFLLQKLGVFQYHRLSEAVWLNLRMQRVRVRLSGIQTVRTSCKVLVDYCKIWAATDDGGVCA
jgi:hypothetical protein